MKRVVLPLIFTAIVTGAAWYFAPQVDHEDPYQKVPETTLELNDRVKNRIIQVVEEDDGILGAVVMRRNFAKGEVPFFFSHLKESIPGEIGQAWWKLQSDPNTAFSSEDLVKNKAGLFYNDEEAMQGKVRCVPIGKTMLRNIAPGFADTVKTACIVTLPAFKTGKDAEVALIFFVSYEIDDEIYMMDVKNAIKALQIGVASYELGKKHRVNGK